jgi:hypothetical protein
MQDWITVVEEQELIVDIVNVNAPGSASLKTIPGMDHFFMIHKSVQDSFSVKAKGAFAAESVPIVVKWLRAIAGLSRTR